MILEPSSVGLVPLQEEIKELACCFLHVRIQQGDCHLPPEMESSPDMELTSILILNFSASKAVRNKFLLLVSHPIYGVLYGTLS